MFEVALSLRDPRLIPAELLAVGLFADGTVPRPADTATRCALDLLDGRGSPEALAADGFSGKAGQSLALPTFGRLAAGTLLLVGLGSCEKLDLETFRRAAAVVVRRSGGAVTAATTIAQAAADPVDAARAVGEGALLAADRSDRDVTNGKVVVGGGGGEVRLRSLDVVLAAGSDEAAGARAVHAGQVRARATNLARDLSNTPSNDLHPADLAAAAEEAVKDHDVSVRILDEHQLPTGGVSRIRCTHPAPYALRLVELVYEPDEPVGSVVLVGKGATFEAGWLDVRPVGGVMTMKTDRSGAAAVAAVMTALAELGIRLKVTGYLTAAPDMSPRALARPNADQPVTIDVEGCQILSDALAWAAASQPDTIVDVAALSGASEAAHGPKMTGLVSDDDQLADELMVAGLAAGEPICPLPGTDRAGLISAMTSRPCRRCPPGGDPRHPPLVGDTPWAHLDIAGASRAKSEAGSMPMGSTGVAVRTLLTWLETRSRCGLPAPVSPSWTSQEPR